MPQKLIDLVGRVFGALTVIARADPPIGANRQSLWLARCECGSVRPYSGGHLRQGRLQSCGCKKSKLIGDALSTHGDTRGVKREPEYIVWCSMRQRCSNPNASKFEDYGGRGIRVCERWSRYENFLEDMGRRPSSSHSIERIDVDGGYEPGNCRWATADDQSVNKRTSRKVTHEGRTLTTSEWAKETGINRSTIELRLNLGWTPERALTTPTDKRRTGRPKK